uniref:Platelet and endothelial cell adhesion molecule 1a n=1 Tax=Kryptolebias marmoratus TaxID=37003 RepID=A0A3Q3A612_KRYMA
MFHVCMQTSAFIIDTMGLWIHPQNTVQSGTPVTIRCQVTVSSVGAFHPEHHFRLTRDDIPIYTSNTSKDSIIYELNPARAADSGSYGCRVTVKDKSKASVNRKLDVTGLQTPTLLLSNSELYESEEFKATCSAPEEKGPLIFHFYKKFRDLDPERIKRILSTGSVSVTTLSFSHIGDCFLSCEYEINLVSGTRRSNRSEEIRVLVKGLSITPVVNVLPSNTVYEGDIVEFHCRVVGSPLKNIEVFLIKNKTILKKEKMALVYRLTAEASDSRELVCKAQWENVQKESYITLTVKEIFSKPKLTLEPTNLYEGNNFKLNCSISIYVPDKIDVNKTKYFYYKDNKDLNTSSPYHSVARPESNGNYTCKVEASYFLTKFTKMSQTLHIQAKVPVSKPVLSVKGGTLFLGKSFQLLCHSENGTLPITYVLFGPDNLREHRQVSKSGEKAVFHRPPIFKSSDLDKFRCQAQNNGREMVGLGEQLRRSTKIIEPLWKPELTIRPSESDISEGQSVSFVCSVQKGSPPITYTWYNAETKNPLYTLTNFKTEGIYTIYNVNGQHGGKYYCESTNAANEGKRSNVVTIGVSMARWKKALIIVFCLLPILALILVIAFRKRLFNQEKRTVSVRSKLSVKSVGTKAERLSLTQAEVFEVSNATPSMMGKSVWSDHVSGSESDDQTSTINQEKQEPQNNEVQTRDPDPNKAPVEQSTDAAPSEARHSQQGVPEKSDSVSVEYAQLNRDNDQQSDNGNHGDHSSNHVTETDEQC